MKNRRSPHSRNGYIALVSVLILTMVIVVVVIAIGTTAFLSRTGAFSAELKSRSRGLAEACVQVAYLRLVSNATYGGAETVTVGSETCRVVSVVDSGTNKVIKTTAAVLGATTNIMITIDKKTFKIQDWQEPVSL